MELDYSSIYEQRMLIFIETEPQSNKYKQLILNPKEFKNISDALGKVVGEVNIDEKTAVGNYVESEEEYELPDLQSSYLEEDINHET